MAPPSYIADGYYLTLTLVITIVYQLLFFAVAFSLKFDKLTDFAGGTNFVLLAAVTLKAGGYYDIRHVLISSFMMLWGTRLSAFLLYRIIKTGKDERFNEIRDKFFPFLGFWVFQMFWVWIVSLPVTVLNSPRVTRYENAGFGSWRDFLGIVLFGTGILTETLADLQKYGFRSMPENKGKFCDRGLWALSRHPNYFGEIILHFGIYSLAASAGFGLNSIPTAPKVALNFTIVGPLFLTILLLFVSGLTLQERPSAKKRYESGNLADWAAYQRYLRRTSILIPFSRRLYVKVPLALKRALFFEWPLYAFDPKKHADADKVREREAEEGRDRDQGTNEDGDAQG